jgi:CheY-like chemotaxis protein/HPt (histidine-containing phosphotransfer) domain-containing protein
LALEILQAAGIRVDVAHNGSQAVGMVGRNPYDGVLMDCQMPVMDGFEATRQIRADGRFAQLPILAMTANAMSGDRELCLASGMSDHIGKPIDITQLFATLARWIKPQNPQAQVQTSAVGAVGMAGAARSGPGAALPAIEGLDLAQAMRRMGGNAKLIRKLMGRFSDTQAGAMERIHAAIAGHDMETATREAHTTKGLAGNIGATQLLAKAGALESALKHGDLDALPPALDAMAAELTRLLNHMAAALGSAPALEQGGAGANLVVDRAVLADELQQLAVLLSDDDSRAGRLVDVLADKLRSVGQGPASAQLQKLIGKYAFEEALEKLQDMAKSLDIAISL